MKRYELADFLEYMSDVKKYHSNLLNLNDQWDSIRLLSEINCPEQAKDILPSMDKIKNSFLELQSELIETLVDQTFKKLEQKTVSKAQVAIDILIRNLYERTADVGFLATDDDVRRFLQLEENRADEQKKMLRRLKQYVMKYSVYEEIIILDKDFTVLINLDPNNQIAGKKINDPMLLETLNSNAGFVETFRKSDLQSNKQKSYIFSSKVCAEDTGKLLGIICLCFKFENEMNMIFEKLTIDYDGSVVMIIDNQNTVLASSDGNHVPECTRVEPVLQDETGIVYYRGLEYISKTVCTKGYQGYYGLGWKGHVMIPLGLAFKENNTRLLEQFDQALIAGLMDKADSFSKALHEIIVKTQKINSSLKRIVFNGQIIMKEDSGDGEYYRLKPLLRSISRTGTDTSKLFEKSVRDLFATVISVSLRDVGFLASLCMDIMDRNLYERANDCRWWAMNRTFRTILAKDELTEYDQLKLTSILSYIHSLYTVYSNLFLFDRTGTIMAVSNPAHSSHIGKKLDKPYVRDILYNWDEDKYYVSDFEASDLYEEKHTYIYGASITDIHSSNHTVGGIGIVFDSDFQFNTMLQDSLSAKEGSFAVFTDRKGLIIASTREEMQPGGILKVPADLLKTNNGITHSEIIIYENNYYAVGCTCSSSYREYKSTDGYDNDVLAFVFDKLAEFEQEETMAKMSSWIEQSHSSLLKNDKHVKLAIFAINQQIFALEQSMILEVIDGDNIIKLPTNNVLIRGAIPYRDQYVTVVDMHAIFDQNAKGSDTSHILIVQMKDHTLIALEADELHNVLEMNESSIKDLPGLKRMVSIIKGVIMCDQVDDSSFVFLLDLDKLLEKLDVQILRLELEKAIQVTKETDETDETELNK